MTFQSVFTLFLRVFFPENARFLKLFSCGGLNAEPDIVIPIFYTNPLSFHEPYLLLDGCIDLETKDADHKQLISLTSTDYSITNTMPMDTDLYGGGLGYVFER